VEQPSDPVSPGSPSRVSPRSPSRRSFLFTLGLVLNAVVLAALGVPIVRYLAGPLARRLGTQTWIDLGPMEGFPSGETRLAVYENPYRVAWDGATAKIACWVRRIEGANFQVFAINCAHLGCPVRWFRESRLFMCPCHGGVYYEDGSRASGPPPRGLFEYEYAIRDGRLFVRGGEIPTLSEPA
jgi:menaquinol-cytochrome c reductase iron-sulfur subunit